MNTAENEYYQNQLDTPLGPMIAIADSEALCLLDFFNQARIERQMRGLKIKVLHKQTVKPLDSIANELALYFEGQLKKFNTPLRFIGTMFQQQVWQQLQKIPFGQTCSYLQMAQALGRPTAYRALANANGANRHTVIVPCHRVINANKELGGYSSGLERKIWLLQHEGGLQ